MPASPQATFPGASGEKAENCGSKCEQQREWLTLGTQEGDWDTWQRKAESHTTVNR